jgi:hypothetical protein
MLTFCPPAVTCLRPHVQVPAESVAVGGTDTGTAGGAQEGKGTPTVEFAHPSTAHVR